MKNGYARVSMTRILTSETYALMLCGLGLLGFMARKEAQKTPALMALE